MADNIANCPARFFTWAIENFDMCPDLPGRPIYSPEFSIDSLKLSKFYLALHPYYEDEDGRGKYVSVYLHRHQSDCGPKSVPLQFKIALLNGNLAPSEYSYVYSEKFKKGTAVGREDFIKRDALLEFIKNEDSFFIRCEYASDDDCGDSYSQLDCNHKDLEQLSCDFEHSFKERLHCDLNLRTSDGILRKAHRAVVRSRCPVLLQQSESDVIANKENALTISSSTLDLLLQYIYSGKIIVENNSAIEYSSLQRYNPAHLQQLLFPALSARACVTKVQVKSSLVVWIVPKFSSETESLKLKKTFCFEESLECTKTVITLDVDSEKDYLRFSIWTVFYEEPIHMSCKIYTFDTKNAKDYDYDLVKGNVWVIHHPIDIKSLEDTLRSNNDSLKIFVELKISDGQFISEVRSTHAIEVTEDQRVSNLWTLQDDLKNFYENPEYSDVTLCVDGNEIKAHKIILSARSAVFSKMFQHNMLEGQTGKVVIKDIKESVLRAILSYLYCAELNLESVDIEFVFDLYAAADRYELLQLRKKCFAYINHEMDPENLGSVLKLADRHNDRSLKTLITTYVTFHASEILMSCEFKKAMRENAISDQEMRNIYHATKELGSTLVVAILWCVYCGELDQEQKCLDNATTLYKNACKHKMHYLQKQCILHFSKIISPENLGKLIELADFNKDETLKVCIDKFVASNSKAIVNSDEWSRIMQEKAYLAADMKNAALAIEDIEVPTMMNFLTIIYMGKLDRKRVRPYSLTKLYTSANKWKLHTLKKACARFLELEISDENFGMVLDLSYNFNDKALRKSVEEYASANVEKILKSYTWRKKFREKWDLADYDHSSFAETLRESGPPVIMAALFVLCCGKFNAKEHDLDTVAKLYEIGHRYKLAKLKRKCVSFFDRAVSESNFSKLLQLSRSCDDEEIELWVEKFASSNAGKILESHECKTITEDKSDLAEDAKKIVSIGNLDPKLLVSVVSYVYTGQLGKDNDLDSIINLYKKVQECKLRHLKKECISVFERQVNAGNVGILLELSDVHKDECLKKCVFDYVCSNASEFLTSKEFTKLKEENSSIIPDLLTAALLALADKNK